MAKQDPCGGKWHPIRHLGSREVMMVRNTNGAVNYVPLYCLSFRMPQPHAYTQTERFFLRYTDPSQISTTADKLRWHRYRKGLCQKDVADLAGLDRKTYAPYESQTHEYYPPQTMERLAAALSVTIEDLLDDYNLFLYRNQGTQIKDLRTHHNLTQHQLARRLDIPIGPLKKRAYHQILLAKADANRIGKEDWTGNVSNELHFQKDDATGASYGTELVRVFQLTDVI